MGCVEYILEFANTWEYFRYMVGLFGMVGFISTIFLWFSFIYFLPTFELSIFNILLSILYWTISFISLSGSTIKTYIFHLPQASQHYITSGFL